MEDAEAHDGEKNGDSKKPIATIGADNAGEKKTSESDDVGWWTLEREEAWRFGGRMKKAIDNSEKTPMKAIDNGEKKTMKAIYNGEKEFDTVFTVRIHV